MRNILFIVISLLWSLSAWPCTSAIISGRLTADGRPLLFKHRDTDCLDNRLAYLHGPRYDMVGLVNATDTGSCVWTGANTAGLCIMNTASYCLRTEQVQCDFEREGWLMYQALGLCATLSDFEYLLDSLLRKDSTGHIAPLCVEANFGVIDAQGGAAYYEVSDYKWTKYDVAASAQGYRLQTNWSESGRKDEWQGVERQQTAEAIWASNVGLLWTPLDLINRFSRSYRHALLDVDYTAANTPEYVIDQDFIPRRITSAVVVCQGVLPNENPANTLLWTTLGYPACAMTVPVTVSEHIPFFMADGGNGHAPLSDAAMQLKHRYCFPLTVSNGPRYLHLSAILRGSDSLPALLPQVMQLDNMIVQDFAPLIKTRRHELLDTIFYEHYKELTTSWWQRFQQTFFPYDD